MGDLQYLHDPQSPQSLLDYKGSYEYDYKRAQQYPHKKNNKKKVLIWANPAAARLKPEG